MRKVALLRAGKRNQASFTKPKKSSRRSFALNLTCEAEDSEVVASGAVDGVACNRRGRYSVDFFRRRVCEGARRRVVSENHARGAWACMVATVDQCRAFGRLAVGVGEACHGRLQCWEALSLLPLERGGRGAFPATCEQFSMAWKKVSRLASAGVLSALQTWIIWMPVTVASIKESWRSTKTSSTLENTPEVMSQRCSSSAHSVTSRPGSVQLS